MKNSYKAALLAALGLTVATAAHAQVANGDLALGFNDLAGTPQNDLVIDLGAANQLGLTSVVTWSGSSLDGGNFASDFTSQFGSAVDPNALNDVAAGLVQGISGEVIQTGNLSGTPSESNANIDYTHASGVNLGKYGSSSSPSAWSEYIASSPTTTFIPTANPMSTLSSGIVTETVYETTYTTGRSGVATAWEDLGTLDINVNTDTVTFTGADAVSVPEPTTYGLLAGAGLLVVSLRNQFRRKQA